MSQFPSSYADGQGYTRREFLRQFFLETGAGEELTLTGPASRSEVVAAKLLTTHILPEELRYHWVRVSRNASAEGTAPEGEYGVISDVSPDEGRIGIQPYTTADLEPGDTVELWHLWRPEESLANLDWVMQEKVWQPEWTYLSELPDHDMEQPGTADWTAVDADIAKLTATPRMNGNRYLRVEATSSNGYAMSPPGFVEPRQQYHLSSWVRAEEGATAELVAWDDTNAQEVQSVSTDSTSLHRIGFNFNVPANCRSLRVLLSTVEPGLHSDWDEVVFFPIGARSISLPWWVKRGSSQIEGYFEQADVGGRIVQEPADFRGRRLQTADFYDLVAGKRLGLSIGSLTRPVYIFGRRYEEPWQDDNTDRKTSPMSLTLAHFCEQLYRTMANLPPAWLNNMKWVQAKLEAAQIERRKAEMSEEVRLQSELGGIRGDQRYYMDYPGGGGDDIFFRPGRF